MYAEVAVDRANVGGGGMAAGEGLVLTYRVPEGADVAPGHMVVVPLSNRVAAGIVVAVKATSDIERVREILRLIDPTPVLTPDQLTLGRWISSYYRSSLYDALNQMLPPGVTQHEVTTLHLVGVREPDARLTARQLRLLGIMRQAEGVITLDRARHKLHDPDLPRVVRQLEQKGLLERRVSLLKPKAQPRRELFVTLVHSADAVSRLGPVQQAALDWLHVQPPKPASPEGNGYELATEHAENGADAPETGANGWRPARALYRDVDGAGRQTLMTLARHGLVEVEEREVWRDPLAGVRPPLQPPPMLTVRQGQVWHEVSAAIEATREVGTTARAFLLHGVTGSGKTEIYLRSIGMALRLGKQAIVLVPEIALTPQTVHRFASRFPGRVAILHSELSAGERYDQWRQIRDGKLDIIVGSRSAVFAPVRNLGLIIVDEEHEWSYKQESNPRYHAREVALHRAALTGSVVILGSATPDIDTYLRATTRKGLEDGPNLRWSIVSLPARVGKARSVGGSEVTTDIPMPPVQLVDMRQELRSGNRSIFSVPLQNAIEATLKAGEQSILFLNRRGSRTFILCRSCGYVHICKRCEVPMVYHSDINQLLCHRCDLHAFPPAFCPQCASDRIKRFGAGTQRVEEELRQLFPAARVLRWDRDTASRKGAHADLLAAFTNHEADILVGTQMIAKGLDLPLVTLVGVVSADTGLHLPDFRSGERTFQLLTQVAGRAGRRTAGGRVIVQTYTPDHYAIQAAQRHDYRSFYLQETRYRLARDYPPYSKMAKLVYSASSDAAAQIEGNRMASAVVELARRQRLEEEIEVIGPAPCFTHKMRNRYRWQILLRGSDLQPLLRHLSLPPGWSLDVDPVSVL